MKKLIIGNIKLDNNVLLAPMAGITDLPLRLLAKAGGAGLVYTGMISAKAILCHNERTKELLKISDKERPVAAQIFGSDVYSLSEAAKIVKDVGVDIIDINLGCPVKKIVKSGSGANLLADEKLLAKILVSIVKSVNIPVTIKIRIGLLPGKNIATGIVQIAQDCGIKMVAVHARPVSRIHSGDPDLKSFAEVCGAGVEIPIIANGGISDEKTASIFFQVRNCSGIMIGRAAIGNYSIFERIGNFFNNGELLAIPSKIERIKWLKQHVKYSMEQYGEKRGFVIMRKVVHYYTKNLPNATKIRNMFNTIVTLSDFNELIKSI
ncbi:MAG: tRNA dihydrouridine synthase DusB [Endomicrobium sp.]|nr:tRNA dihydrouridine synthase DusB [Endomicrobium sp.]